MLYISPSTQYIKGFSQIFYSFCTKTEHKANLQDQNRSLTEQQTSLSWKSENWWVNFHHIHCHNELRALTHTEKMHFKKTCYGYHLSHSSQTFCIVHHFSVNMLFIPFYFSTRKSYSWQIPIWGFYTHFKHDKYWKLFLMLFFLKFLSDQCTNTHFKISEATFQTVSTLLPIITLITLSKTFDLAHAHLYTHKYVCRTVPVRFLFSLHFLYFW